MRILVTGSRDWTDRLAVYRTLNNVCEEFDLNFPPDEHGNTLPDPRKITVVHGHCPTGADHWADQWCISNFLTPERHPADWARYGKRAGFIRNIEMVNLGADLTLAFWKNRSPGTAGTIDLSRIEGIETRILREGP